MLYYHLGDLNEKAVQDLLLFFNDWNRVSKSSQDINIYFASAGGEYGAMLAILDVLTRHKDYTILTGYQELCSSAFELFFTAPCKRVLLPSTIGMFHKAYIELTMDEKGQVAKNDKIRLNQLKYSKKKTKEICKILNISKGEMDAIDKGEDVYFTSEQMEGFLDLVQPRGKS